VPCSGLPERCGFERDWLREQVAAASQSYYAGLRARYEVRIESQRQRVATLAR